MEHPDHQTYVVGYDEDGPHTFLTIDTDQQCVVIIQAGDDPDDPDDQDVVAVPPELLSNIARLVAEHTDRDGNLFLKETLSVN